MSASPFRTSTSSNASLYPNVDFYSGLIYEAMGFRDFFTVLFAIPRTVGWLAQWREMLEDSETGSPARARSTPASSAAPTERPAAPFEAERNRGFEAS